MPVAHPQPGEVAPDVTLTDDTGATVQLSEFWSRRPTVLLFVRHFG